jgi:hypothetical protein
MLIKDLDLKKITASALIHRLSEEGWTANHDSLAQELVQRLATNLESFASVSKCGENMLTFILHTINVRLRALHEIPCLLVGGENVSDDLSDFWKRYNTTSHIPMVLTTSPGAFDQAVSHLSNGRCFILSSEQIRDLLNASDSLQLFKRYIGEQVPRRSLIPYSISKSAEGGMFFGREEELCRLEEEDSNSFSIAGPGRVGKTSLIKRYLRQKLYTHDRRAMRFEVTFYKSDPNADAQARLFAMAISPSRQSDRMTASGLVNFMRYMHGIHKKPIELLLDEVDEVCQGDVLKYLGEAAKMGLCRLVLAGKGDLLKMMLNSNSPLDCRLELLQLGPLDDNSAKALLLLPLRDLGFSIEQTDQLLDHTLALTGRLPHLLQLFGRKLAEYAIREDTRVINLDLLEKTKGDYLIPHFFVKSLNDLKDPETRLIGLLLVSEGRTDNISSLDLRELGEREGLQLNSQRLNDICIDLVINNVLVWHHGSYRLANEGLPYYARQTQYLANALRDAHSAVPTGA